MKIQNLKIILPLLLFMACTRLQKINEEYNEAARKRENIISICPEGAYYEGCGSGCGLPHCGSPDFEGITECPCVCVSGCVCTGGKLLDRLINQCVEPEDCSY